MKDKLILVRCPNGEWTAHYKGEEDILYSETHEERLEEAAGVWGISVDSNDTKYYVNYDIRG